jgi:hypothetical protein
MVDARVKMKLSKLGALIQIANSEYIELIGLVAAVEQQEKAVEVKPNG